MFKILRGAHESSRLAAHCAADRAERSSGFRREEYDRFLSSVWNGHVYAFIMNRFSPGFDARKPVSPEEDSSIPAEKK